MKNKLMLTIGILLIAGILFSVLPLNSGVGSVADAATSNAVAMKNGYSLKTNTAPAPHINPKIGKLTPSQKNVLREAAAEQLAVVLQQAGTPLDNTQHTTTIILNYYPSKIL